MIKISNLSKTIHKKVILKNITAELKGITGIIGPNGAGKTTLMEIIASAQKSDDGSIIEYQTINHHAKLGYLPQNFDVYPNLTVNQVLDLIATLKNSYDKFHINKLIEQMNLKKYRNVKLKRLSGGTLQRVGIAQALLNKPDFLIIDEPTTGLDIIESINLRNALLSIKDEVEIIISSHIPEDITFICNHLLVINEGEKVFEGSIEDLIENTTNLIYEATIKKVDLTKICDLGRIISVNPKSKSEVKVRLVAFEPLENNNLFNKVKPDFLSSFIHLLDGEQ